MVLENCDACVVNAKKKKKGKIFGDPVADIEW